MESRKRFVFVLVICSCGVLAMDNLSSGEVCHRDADGKCILEISDAGMNAGDERCTFRFFGSGLWRFVRCVTPGWRNALQFSLLASVVTLAYYGGYASGHADMLVPCQQTWEAQRAQLIRLCLRTCWGNGWEFLQQEQCHMRCLEKMAELLITC